jgi:hypothetical protein
VDKRAVVAAALRARRRGATLRQAATQAGVHVATLCRWQARDPQLRRGLAEAAAGWRDLLARARQEQRERVPWHPACPLCRAKVVVRTARGRARFWRCGRWPDCPWASWRPRAVRNCRRCGGILY